MGRRKKEFSDENIRDRILQEAVVLISQEGIDGLSVRKITSRLGYTPGILYHYFEDKEEIIKTLLFDWYGEILKAVMDVPAEGNSPVEEIRLRARAYFDKMLESPDLYRAFMLSSNEEIKSHTRILDIGRSESSPPLGMLRTLIEDGMRDGSLDVMDSENAAQLFWTALFGLIIKVIIDGVEDVRRRDELFNRMMTLLLGGMGYNGV